MVGFSRELWAGWRPSIYRRYKAAIPRVDTLPAALKATLTAQHQSGETMASLRTRLDPSLLSRLSAADLAARRHALGLERVGAGVHPAAFGRGGAADEGGRLLIPSAIADPGPTVVAGDHRAPDDAQRCVDLCCCVSTDVRCARVRAAGARLSRASPRIARTRTGRITIG